MARVVGRLLGHVYAVKRRWVAHGLPDYPLWIAALIDSSVLVTAVIAVGQRLTDPGSLPLTVALVALAGLPWLLEIWLMGRAWPAFVVLTCGAVATLMVAVPVDYEFVPFLLVVMAGHVTAVAGVWRGAVVTLAGEAVVLLAALHGELAGPEAAIWALAVLVGLDLGFIIRSQQLRIEAQAREHTVRERQAVLEERQRIAREVHDLVAHSLGVTMLHLTAARRDVADAAETTANGELADALDALVEAERVGRRAMADIRATVGLLRTDEPGPAQAPPDLAAVEELVAEYQRAGLDVAVELRGDLAGVPASTGLGLYRIVQESLANCAKHAPRAPVRLLLDLDAGELVVANRGAVRRNPGGSGLAGMRARAEQLGATLSAGPTEQGWEVRVVLA
jgi:signal transduction histidine kinase